MVWIPDHPPNPVAPPAPETDLVAGIVGPVSKWAPTPARKKTLNDTLRVFNSILWGPISSPDEGGARDRATAEDRPLVRIEAVKEYMCLVFDSVKAAKFWTSKMNHRVFGGESASFLWSVNTGDWEDLRVPQTLFWLIQYIGSGDVVAQGKAMITGLVARPELNGCACELLGSDKETDRQIVVLPDGSKVKLKQSNLQECTDVHHLQLRIAAEKDRTGTFEPGMPREQMSSWLARSLQRLEGELKYETHECAESSICGCSRCRKSRPAPGA